MQEFKLLLVTVNSSLTLFVLQLQEAYMKRKEDDTKARKEKEEGERARAEQLKRIIWQHFNMAGGRSDQPTRSRSGTHPSPEDQASLARNQITFELPVNFRHPARYMPPVGAFQRAMNPPERVINALMEAIGRDVPPDANIPFIYLRANRFPVFVLNYFMDIQGPVRIALSTRFFRALHLIEATREAVINPPMPGLLPVFPAAAQDDEEDEDDDDEDAQG